MVFSGLSRQLLGKHSSQLLAGIEDALHSQGSGWRSPICRAVVEAALTGSVSIENYEPLLVLLHACTCVHVCRGQVAGMR